MRFDPDQEVGMSTRIRPLGLAVLLVGAWGALIPFVGPSFGYRMGATAAWTWSESHVTLHLLPGLAAFLGGSVVFGAARRHARWGAALALLGGIWFVVGPTLHNAWASSGSGSMMMGDSVWSQIATSLGYHYGTGVIITALAAYALGALAVLAHAAEAAASVATSLAVGAAVPGDREPARIS